MAVVAVLAVVGAGASVAFALRTGGEGPPGPWTGPSAPGTPTLPPAWPEIARLPDPCSSVSGTTLQRIAPGQGGDRRSGPDARYRSCSWGLSASDRTSDLKITLELNRALGGYTGGAQARDHYQSRRRQADSPDRKAEFNVQPVEQVSGLGEEAYFQYEIQGTAGGQGELVVLIRNVLLTVSYLRSDPGGKPMDPGTARQETAQVAREVIPHIR